MTTYIQSLQRESDKRWDKTSSTGSTKPHPIGYCAGWKEPATGEEAERLAKQFGPGFVERLNADIEAKREHQAKYHTDGHATAAEADECHLQYQLDQELEFYEPPAKPDSKHRCQAPYCDDFTAGLAILGGHRRFYLCDAHRNRGEVEKLVRVKRKAISFDELVEYGKANGGNIVDGMPWSFTYEGCPVSHENNNCYVINTPKETLHFNRGDFLITSGTGELYLSTSI